MILQNIFKDIEKANADEGKILQTQAEEAAWKEKKAKIPRKVENSKLNSQMQEESQGQTERLHSATLDKIAEILDQIRNKEKKKVLIQELLEDHLEGLNRKMRVDDGLVSQLKFFENYEFPMILTEEKRELIKEREREMTKIA